jgi:type VI secretion system protein ImpA
VDSLDAQTDHSLSDETPEGAARNSPAGRGAGQSQQQGLTGTIASKEDVLKALDLIIGHYEKSEPSSPVPLLIKRAKRLVGKSFVDVIRDISPDALTQGFMVSGEEETPDE